MIPHCSTLHAYSMSSDGLQCPEDSNSTDCLLRALLSLLGEQKEAQDAEIDWDPINFAVTLLIGLLAIFFALATILQAIFAARKGRRRTSHLEIGQWSQKTTRRWDWPEMNFQFTASTPILRERSLPAVPSKSGAKKDRDDDHVDGEHEKKNADEEPAPGTQVVDSTGSPHTGALRAGIRGLWANARKLGSKLHQNQARRPSAAWLEFFEEVGLDTLDCRAWGPSVREVAADYLPDDLVAAPAYAQIGAIVSAAATAGIQKLDVDQQNYPILLGQGFQVDFRQHPALGVVCAYSRYDKTSKRPSLLNLDELRSTMRFGRGNINAMTTMDLSTNSTRRQLLERWNMISKALAIGETPNTRSIFPLKLATITEDCLPLIAGLFAHTPKHVPVLFPNTTMRANSFLTALALNGKYWAAAPVDRFGQSQILDWPKSPATPNWHGFDWHGLSFSKFTQTINNLYKTLVLNLNIEDLSAKSSLDFRLSAYEMARLRDQTGKSLASIEEKLKALQQSVGRLPGPGPGSRAVPMETKVSITGPQSRAKEEVVIPHTVLGEAEPSPKNSKDFIGHEIVLKICLRLLWEPEKLEQWFFEVSSNGQGALRCIILEQIKEVDQWLRENQADVGYRSTVLCNTTIVLLKTEQMIENGSLCKPQPEPSLGHMGRCQPGEQNPGQSTEWEQPRRNTAREIHSDTLLVLRDLVDHLDEDQPEAREVARLMEVQEAFPSSRLWDRLSTLVIYHSAEESHWPLWVRFHKERNNKMARDIDDVIIYRCLMMILLFRTAADSSKILESGLWDKVVPMI